jgi:hypothetical protein
MAMRRQQTWFAAIVAVLIVGCVRLDESHCANQDGDATCAERDPAQAFCSACTATNDGCVAESVAPECVPTADTESSTGATSIATTLDDDGIDDDDGDDPSMTSNPVGGSDETIGEATTAALTTTASSSSSDEDGSTSFPSSTDTGETSSAESSSDTGPECGNGIQEGDEQCDKMDLNGESCASLPETKGPGALACDEFCMFNTTQCDACTPALGLCATDDDCCAGTCGVVVNGLCPP